ncbi:hypothetical protein NL526_30245, partial [Klebsiella pneumoniae]|nr:hypothetical protein [Klebsiella pneumoniae]
LCVNQVPRELTVRAIPSASASVVPSGFSHRIAQPRALAASTSAACRTVSLQIATALQRASRASSEDSKVVPNHVAASE